MSKRGERIARGDKDRARYIEKLYQTSLSKIAAVREVSRVYPEYLPDMVKFLDRSDEFWEKRQDLNVEDWPAVCEKSRKEAA